MPTSCLQIRKLLIRRAEGGHRTLTVDLRAAVLIAVMLLVGSWLGANLVGRLDTRMIKAAFGGFLVALGAWISFEALSSR